MQKVALTLNIFCAFVCKVLLMIELTSYFSDTQLFYFAIRNVKFVHKYFHSVIHLCQVVALVCILDTKMSHLVGFRRKLQMGTLCQ